ncbi:hypothetical protein BJ508DRAFT_307746 [Ascobolus immersus RN42]|uniref:Uncharacterized protein n=1 Tax=Ascobolus immersus RN42 TaxID=1160509 RepID=A0A3N4I3H9_ASCIM|nr:hypothetical protein BJ508DRAFT_307746 [Ascobolus immersus RN42]
MSQSSPATPKEENHASSSPPSSPAVSIPSPPATISIPSPPIGIYTPHGTSPAGYKGPGKLIYQLDLETSAWMRTACAEELFPSYQAFFPEHVFQELSKIEIGKQWKAWTNFLAGRYRDSKQQLAVRWVHVVMKQKVENGVLKEVAGTVFVELVGPC